MTLRMTVAFAAVAFLMVLARSSLMPILAHGDENHRDAPQADKMLEQMRELHKGHEHEHAFEAIERMTPERMQEVMLAVRDLGLAVPPMDAHRGRELFLQKGCIVCHQVNGVGGEIGPPLDAADMPVPMNAFEFAARMWRGADAMIQMQRQLFGDQIELTGKDLADLVAFAHDEAEQAELSEDDIPDDLKKMIQ